jgi:hypothetical protein
MTRRSKNKRAVPVIRIVETLYVCPLPYGRGSSNGMPEKQVKARCPTNRDGNGADLRSYAQVLLVSPGHPTSAATGLILRVQADLNASTILLVFY